VRTFVGYNIAFACEVTKHLEQAKEGCNQASLRYQLLGYPSPMHIIGKACVAGPAAATESQPVSKWFTFFHSRGKPGWLLLCQTHQPGLLHIIYALTLQNLKHGLPRGGMSLPIHQELFSQSYWWALLT